MKTMCWRSSSFHGLLAPTRIPQAAQQLATGAKGRAMVIAARRRRAAAMWASGDDDGDGVAGAAIDGGDEGNVFPKDFVAHRSVVLSIAACPDAEHTLLTADGQGYLLGWCSAGLASERDSEGPQHRPSVV
jgi:hypothetical protein